MTLFHTSLALRPVMELLKYAVCDTCESPVRTHEISPATHPSHTHTHTHGFIHTGHQHHRGQGRGAQSGLRCKTAPACFNFHLPHQDPLRPEAQEAPPLHVPPLQSPLAVQRWILFQRRDATSPHSGSGTKKMRKLKPHTKRRLLRSSHPRLIALRAYQRLLDQFLAICIHKNVSSQEKHTQMRVCIFL